MFRHPKYYKELRKRNKSDQTISLTLADGCNGSVRSGPGLKQQAASDSQVVNQVKLSSQSQAASTKLQAPSESSNKPQASSPKQQASSSKPQASSSKIWLPRKSFTVPEPRASTIINVLCGCFTWKLIWCGENLILFPLHTFSSTVKKWPEVLQANRSGVPSKLLFSSLIHEICGIDFLIFS